MTSISSILSQLDAAEKAASKGPWGWDGRSIGREVEPWDDVVGIETRGAPFMQYEELVLAPLDAALIVLMRNSLRPLLSHVAALEAERDEAVKALNNDAEFDETKAALALSYEERDQLEATMLASADEIDSLRASLALYAELEKETQSLSDCIIWCEERDEPVSRYVTEDNERVVAALSAIREAREAGEKK